MAGSASIVVDIKAQITGYQEQIEKIKAELKKVDPGSAVGKSLNKILVQAEQKLAQLSRNAEKRVTSQGQLNHLFDQLNLVNDLMRQLGQGMSSVGLDDVLETASGKARELGQSLREVKTEMATKGNSFFEELKRTNPDELKAVFEQLKFDPKTMGIDEFVEKFKEATKQAQEEVKNLSDKQKEAQAELQRTQSMKEARDKLPVALQGATVTQGAIRNAFGAGGKGMDAAKLVSDRNTAAEEFIQKIRAGLEADTTRSDENKTNLAATLETTLTQLQEAKTKEQIESILQDLDKALKSTKGEGRGGSHKGIVGLTGESLNGGLVEKLSQSTYQADQNFVNQIQELADLLSKSSNADAQGAGKEIQNILNNLLQPTDITTFRDNMDALIRAIQQGLQKLNQTKSDFDVKTKESILNQTSTALNAAKGQVANLEKVSTSQAYTKLMEEYNELDRRMREIEQMLGLEKTNNRAGVAGGVNEGGQKLLQWLPKMNEEATTSLKQYSSVLEDVQARQQMVGRVEGIAQRWFSVYAAVRMVSKAFRSMVENIKALDKTITEIAIVTDMGQSDLWKQMPTYTTMARKYGATLQGVYEVSQLYYQQGLEQDDVMALTEQTLKMARISGLDYSDATNYMTNAIRSFKIEMQDAQRVVDVYSALAASSASSTTELATAMSKTASSAAAVGSSFEATSAMMAVMIETTRESPENIGSALKSIISRYGELKENKTGIDEEGEEYSLNKVDTALQSVGISIHDAQGQFRDFDEVIMELAEHWDTIDTNTQRYIATVMAGNRQQSRFLALVSNGERLAELNETAENSEDASTLQVLKTMDSIDYKSQQLQTTLQNLYTSTGIENLFKGILDGANQIVETFTQMPTLLQLPIPAIASLATNFVSTANIVMTALKVLKQKFVAQSKVLSTEELYNQMAIDAQRVKQAELTEEEISQIRIKAAEKHQLLQQSQKAGGFGNLKKESKLALGAQLAGVGMNLAAGLISDKGAGNRAAKATLGIGGSMLQYGAMGAMFSPANPLLGAGVGAALGAVIGLWQNIQYIFQSTADQAKRLKEEAEEAQTKYKQEGAKTRSIEKELKNVQALAKAQNDSAEAREKYIEASNKLGAEMPELVSYYDEEGNAVLDLSNAYELLAEKRREANEAASESANASIEAAKKNTEVQQDNLKNIINTVMTGSINYSKLTGQSATDWSQILKNATTVKDENGYFSAYGSLKKINDQNQGLDDLAKIVYKNVNDTTPYITQMLSQLQSTSGRNALGNDLLRQRDTMLNYWRDEMTHITDPLTSQIVKFIIDQLESGVSDLVDASGKLAGAEATEKSIVHSQMADYVNRYREAQSDIVNFSTDQNKIKEAQKNLDLFKDLNNSSEIITTFLTQKFIDSGKTWKEFEEDTTKDGLAETRDTIVSLLQQIPTTALDSINTLFEERGKYTKEQFRSKLNNIIQNEDITDEIMKTQLQYYKKVLNDENFKTAIKERNKNTENKLKFDLDKLKLTDEDGLSLFSGEELTNIISMVDKINSLYKHGNITEANGQEFLNQYIDLWNGSNEAEQKIISSITDFSDEGLKNINKLIDDSKDMTDNEKSILKTSIAALFGLVPQNLNTALKSYEEKMSEATENYSKDMSSATKGMDYKAAIEMAQKLDIQPTAEYFDIREGELFLKNTQLIYDHYFGESGQMTLLNASLEANAKAMQEHLNDIKTLKLEDIEKWTQEDADEYGLDLNTLKTFIEDSKDKEITKDYITQYFQGKITNAQQLLNEFLKSDELNRVIDSGTIEEIVKTGTKKDKFIEGYYYQILGILNNTGDFSSALGNENYTDEFKAKLPELKKNYDEAQSSVIESLIGHLDETFTLIEGSNLNQSLLESLKSSSLVKLTEPINGISNAIVTATRKQILAYLEANENGLPGMKKEDIREKIASLHQEDYTKSADGALQAVLESYDNIDEVTYKNFTDYFGIDEDQVNRLFTVKANGNRKTNLPELIKQLQLDSIFNKLDNVTQEKIKEVAAQAIDDGMASITNAAGYVTKGTTKYQDMYDFVKLFNDAIPDANASIEQLFTYDQNAQGYVLDASKYKEYLQHEAQLLAALGEDTTYINGLIDTANQSLANAIDISSFLQSENKDVTGKAYKTLQKAFSDYILSSDELYEKGIDLIMSTYHSNLQETEYTNIKQELISQDRNIIAKGIADIYINQIKQGGISAVRAMQAVAKAQGQELTASDIESAYRSQISELEDAFEQLSYGPGALISGQAKAIYDAIDETYQYHTKIDDTTAVITGTLTDISDLYQKYFYRLKETEEATLAALNEAYAKVLETEDSRAMEQAAIDLLGDAQGMTYTTLGTILSEAGYDLENNIEILRQGIIEEIGGNKIRIKDFSAFAQLMGWDFNSEEYISAFKTYNDGLIELNRKTEKSIVEEIKQLENAKPGDQLNFTIFSSKINEFLNKSAQTLLDEAFDAIVNTGKGSGLDALAVAAEHEALQKQLYGYGAYLQDGILYLEDNANLLGIAQTLKSVAEASGLDFQNGLQEIADTIQNILKSYAEIISNGIEGGLTNVDAADLRSKAKDLGIENISFTETVEGLKLSQQSAIALYTELRKIDTLQASLVFDKLNESLKESNDSYKSVTTLMAHIRDLGTKIDQLKANRSSLNDVDQKTTNAKIEQYEKELALAKEILAVRSTQEDSSFNFMSNEIPAAQKNPLNYAKNLTQAFQTFRDAFDLSKVKKNGKTGFMDYEDWYNIVTEFNNIATKDAPIILSDSIKLDGTLQAASKAIQAGASSLTNVDTGELKVNLTNVGIDIKSGASVLSSGVTEGIQSVAKAQMNALDGLIQMLELIVAMEELGNIAGEDTTIDLGDIVIEEPNGAQFNKNYKKWVDKVKKLIDKNDDNYNEQLAEAFKGVKLNVDGKAFSLEEMLDFSASDLSANKSLGKAYAALINSFVQAAQSGDYDLNNIAQSVQQELAKAGVFDEAITIDIGESTLIFSGSSHAEIKWDDKDVQDLIEKIGTDGKEQLTTAMSKWVRNIPLEGNELEYVLAIKKKIIYKDDGKISITVGKETEEFDDTEDSPKKDAWLGAAALEEKGYDPEKITKVDAEGYAETEIEFENKTTMKVKGSSEGVQYESKDGDWYDSQEKALKADYKLYQEDIEAGGERLAKWGTKRYASQAEYNWGERQIRAKITPKVTLDTNDAEVDLSVSSTIRERVQEELSQLTEKQLNRSKDGTGNYKVSIGGATFLLSGADVEFEGKPDLQKAIAIIKSQFLGEDLGLQDNIIKGIQGAFKDGIELKISKETTESDISEIQKAINDLKQEKPIEIEVTDNGTIAAIQEAINNIKNGEAHIDVYERYHASSPVQKPNQQPQGSGKVPIYPVATGNIGLAKAKGTLMGELGPELVVSNGRYFVAGQNGPEMIDLADDAIVFNHLQTKSLLEKGMSSGRGQAVTNERNAVSFATGNVNGGPAMASASQALAALKELRAQWDALSKLSAKDLAGKGGGGGGGGGGDAKSFLKDLERWYDWLQQIAQLEKEITLEEAKRTKYQNDMIARGKEYYTSQVQTLKKLQEQLTTQQSLTNSQEEYFEKRRKELNEQSAFSALYGFSESGQLYYKDVYKDNKSAFEWLSDLVGRNAVTGEANYTAEEQYNKLVEAGFEFAMKYDSSGNEIEQKGKEWYSTAVQAFWDKIDADKEEMQSLHDSVEDGYKQIYDLQNEQNEILHEIEDNQITVENKVLKAVEETRQRQIDKLSEQKDAIQKGNEDLLNGLSNALEKERQLYETAESERDLESKRRQLSILKRSGGSASEIKSLQAEIDSSSRDLYFEKQQEQIDAIQEASDLQIKKLEDQINIMTETLEYQKKFGLLWDQVAEILRGSPNEIAQYIKDNTEEYWGQSTTELAKTVREDLFEIERFKQFQETADASFDVLSKIYGTTEEGKAERKKQEEEEKKAANAAEANSGGSGSGKSGSSKNSGTNNNVEVIKGKKKYKVLGETFDTREEAETYLKNVRKDTKNTIGMTSEVKEVDAEFVQTTSTNKKGEKTTTKTEIKSMNDKRSAGDYVKDSQGRLFQVQKDGSWKLVKQKTEKEASGGYVNHGLYELGELGTETVLTASQTKILRDNILSNRPDSLISLLKSYNEAYHGLSQSTYDSISDNSNTVTIEHAEVNMKVEKLADSYDAAKAGDDVMREILNIARKTSAQNRVGR